ncbi:MAG: response regulator [Chloroflexi bacterium]|nr:response regulator [Chloroflexota bacterium]
MEKNVHILIVEDSLTQTLKLRELLEQNGYNVSAANDGKQALAMLEELVPDIIISDIVIPGMSGYELCEEIKRREHLKNIPVILLTLLSDPEDVIKGLISGASNFIVKPYDDEFLLSRIRYILVNQEIRKESPSQMGIDLHFREKRYFLSSERIQIIDLLLSTYEAAVQKNLEFKKANGKLEQARAELEIRVQERTAELQKANEAMKKEIEERKRAEQDLVLSNTILSTQQETSIDGILVVDAHEKIISFNRRFIEIWGIPPGVIESRSDRLALQAVTDKLANPEGFIEQVNYLYEHKEEKSRDEIKLRDGRFLDRYSAPMIGAEGNYYGRVWYFRDITERKVAEEAVKASLKEKELLLKEIHHRVKNNLQIISSLLNLQSQYIKDDSALELFTESRNCIKSMALIHESLYGSEDMVSIDFADYVRKMANYLYRSHGINTDKIIFKTDISDIFLGIDTAIPCGLIINELITNSLKHSFPGGRKGTIEISLKRDNGGYILVIRDDGASISEEVDLKSSETLGLQLVYDLIAQIDGKLELDRRGGTEFRIKFKELKYKNRGI